MIPSLPLGNTHSQLFTPEQVWMALIKMNTESDCDQRILKYLLTLQMGITVHVGPSGKRLHKACPAILSPLNKLWQNLWLCRRPDAGCVSLCRRLQDGTNGDGKNRVGVSRGARH